MYKKFAKIYDSFMETCDYEEWKSQVYLILKNKNKLNKNLKLLDVGCGTGEFLLRAYKEYNCSGLDISENMLKIAQKKIGNKEIKLYKGNMIEFDINEKFDIIVSLFDTVNHILSNDELTQHLISIKNHLKEDGIYIFDVVDRKFMNEMFTSEYFVDNRKNLTIIWEHEIEEGIDYIDATYFLKNKLGSYDKLEETYEKKIFTHNEIIESIGKAKLRFSQVIENNVIAGTRYFYIVENS